MKQRALPPMSTRMPQLAYVATAAVALSFLAPAASAVAVSGAVNVRDNLKSHRAVYEIRLGHSESASGITALRGRMVFSFSSAACGFVQDMRLVTQMTDREGNGILSDLQTRSSEAAAGKSYRFDSKTFRNSALAEATAGEASRADNGSVQIDLALPEPMTIDIGSDAQFPVQHSIAMLEAAWRGERLLNIPLYDGSDNGAKVYETTTLIGARREGGAVAGANAPPVIEPPADQGAASDNSDPNQDPNQDDDADAGAAAPEAFSASEPGDPQRIADLAQLPSWPVSISYFERKEEPGERIPAYEMAFRLFANGVVRDLRIDYGDFSLEGELTSLVYSEPTDCRKF